MMDSATFGNFFEGLSTNSTEFCDLAHYFFEIEGGIFRFVGSITRIISFKGRKEDEMKRGVVFAGVLGALVLALVITH